MCTRFRVLMILGLVLFGALCGVLIQRVVTGQLPDYSPGRLLGAAGLGLLLGGITVLLAAALRARVVIDDAGVELVWSFRRQRVAWHEIEDISLVRGHRLWRVRLRSVDASSRCGACSARSGSTGGSATRSFTSHRGSLRGRCGARTNGCAKSGYRRELSSRR